MPALSLEEFVRQLSDSGLLSSMDLNAFQQSLPAGARPRDAEGLARALAQAGKLTRYQAAAIAQGRAKNLVFGEYRVLDKIGQGGMGVVLKAEHRRMKRQVAIKVLPAAALRSPQAVQRFYREVEAAGQLNHPNIVCAYDASEHQGMHYLVMELIDGRDLASIIKQRGPLPIRQAVECVIQAARGLHYAHEKGIVHRDIKPANLLLDKTGTVKILDMGLARMDQGTEIDAGGERLTQSGQVMGTCDYMAPEQSLDTHTVDGRADIYSLGCTLYRLLTGKTPYQAESFAKLFLAHLNAPIPPLSAERSDVSPELDAICQKMMAKRPEDRQQSMAQVIAELEGYLGTRRSAAADEESLSDGALEFLREFTRGATSGTRQVAQPHVDDTFQHQPRAEAGTDVGAQRLLGGGNRKIAMLLGGAALVLAVAAAGVVITIRGRGGERTTIDVPEGSQVAVRADGKVDVTLPKPEDEGLREAERRWGLKRQDAAPAASPRGFNPRLASEAPPASAPASPLLAPDGEWWLPPGAPRPAIAPFDEAQARELQQAWATYLDVPVKFTNSIGMEFVLIPPGEYEMGTDARLQNERLAKASKLEAFLGSAPQHHVRISRPFYLGCCEVRRSQYAKLIQPPATWKGPADHWPAVNLRWEECRQFCETLSQADAERAAERIYRLPTEAEWEYACRAGSTSRYVFGEKPSDLAPYARPWDCNRRELDAVGQKKSSPWGLFDMLGNALEFCSDRYDRDYYRVSPVNDPPGTNGGSSHVIRGGYYGSVWDKWSDAGPDCRAYASDGGRDFVSFRVLCEVNIPRDAGGLAQLKRPSTLVDAEGQWKLPSGAPQPAIAPFDEKQAGEFQQAWAKYLGLPAETTNSLGMPLVLIPPGECQIDPLKKPAGQFKQRVVISKPFWIGRTEVTVGQWKAFVEATHYVTDAEKPDDKSDRAVVSLTPEPAMGGPAEGRNWHDPRKDFVQLDTHAVGWISWNDAVAFCRWLTEREHQEGRLAAGLRVRLPTEAEWEYACRAGMATRFWWGDDPEDSQGRLNLGKVRDEFPYVATVDHYGARGRNHFGLADMLANVRELCLDGCDPAGAHASLWGANADKHMTRGGCLARDIKAAHCAGRDPIGATGRQACTGFRICCEIADPAPRP
jgi:serine/threonine-protein kinase